ncbi:hypothetical protein BV22DRAFT_1115833 [Leucogyrophana mollusca]|uniref:Uncharacterized protein n=1 Tax=Leucogyrophana mollusca TaxID=85980 RepID=A0ACB8BZB3_9AGAM|nr:hypothetical protein BV22DRAFT_1115833 [Leucogyrophana mollusca]
MNNNQQASLIYDARANSGLYDSVVDQALALPPGTALAEAGYNVDFTKVINPYTNNISYKKMGTSAEAEMVLFAQLGGSALGGKFSARGDHYVGNGFNPNLIDDKTRIKFILALCRPTNATERLAILYDNQLATLSDIIEADRAELEERGKHPQIKEWTSHSGTDTGLPADIINVRTTQIYVVPKDPRSGTPSAKKAKITKRPVVNSAAHASDAAKPVKMDDDESMEATGEDPKPPTPAPDISTNDLYDPTVLSDYGGFPFAHVHAKLRQLDFRDTNNELVRPQDWYDKFRPGSLVMVKVTLHAFNWDERRVYQINAHTIRLLDGSAENIELRLQKDGNAVASSSTETNTAASDAVASFSLGKRARDCLCGVTSGIPSKRPPQCTPSLPTPHLTLRWAEPGHYGGADWSCSLNWASAPSHRPLHLPLHTLIRPLNLLSSQSQLVIRVYTRLECAVAHEKPCTSRLIPRIANMDSPPAIDRSFTQYPVPTNCTIAHNMEANIYKGCETAPNVARALFYAAACDCQKPHMVHVPKNDEGFPRIDYWIPRVDYWTHPSFDSVVVHRTTFNHLPGTSSSFKEGYSAFNMAQCYPLPANATLADSLGKRKLKGDVLVIKHARLDTSRILDMDCEDINLVTATLTSSILAGEMGRDINCTSHLTT